MTAEEKKAIADVIAEVQNSKDISLLNKIPGGPAVAAVAALFLFWMAPKYLEKLEKGQENIANLTIAVNQLKREIQDVKEDFSELKNDAKNSTKDRYTSKQAEADRSVYIRRLIDVEADQDSKAKRIEKIEKDLLEMRIIGQRVMESK